MTDDQPPTIRLADVRSIPDLSLVGPDSTPTSTTTSPDASETASTWTPIDLSSLEEKPPVEPTLGGLGLVYPGKRHVFSGPQESAKTLAAYAIAIQVVRTGETVLLIDFEMGPWDARNRLRELGATQDELASVLYVEPDTPATLETIQGLVALTPALVLIDAAAGAYDLQQLDDNKRGDVERFTSVYVREFWKAGIATIVLDHVVKNVDGRGNYAIGSERKVGGADVHLGFSVVHPIKRGSTGVYKVTTHKDRGGYLKRGKLADFHIASDPDTHALTWEFKEATLVDEDHPFRPTVKMEQASKWLEKQMEENVPISHIVSGIGGDSNVAYDAINILVNEGWFTEEKGPRKARLMTLARPYREEFDDLSATSLDLSENEGSSDLSTSLLPLQGQRGETESSSRSERSEFGTDDIPF